MMMMIACSTQTHTHWLINDKYKNNDDHQWHTQGQRVERRRNNTNKITNGANDTGPLDVGQVKTGATMDLLLYVGAVISLYALDLVAPLSFYIYIYRKSVPLTCVPVCVCVCVNTLCRAISIV